MRDFQTAELSSLRASQTATMQDRCTVYAHSGGASDGYGQPADGYTAGESTPCGYKSRSTREVQQGNETVTVDAELRLPYGTEIKSLDRVAVTHRYGMELDTPLFFYVVGLPALGLSATVVNLKRVADG